ncbi:hypothetical protein GCM10007301_41340 [Azorhizobium oxalatiphilum]|uniref:Type II toxin-antitoxin system RelE/ParE family toxin n=1 Tax=Azorhizobium oxalatiphilum TaxID=980631 RepID=A0A917CA36_9HYPH|nr:type II toxin-antitoxin system RelE/ParE family toxin [Azorhizobium oxalatiphilum]GGF77143.1 hypothetical protein GCM10007301_41340 [Azorhizobium oxalatiphilum]
MPKLRYLPAALRDLGSIFDYIAERNDHPATARSFTARLRKRCRQLASTPGLLGTARPELGPDFRCLPFRDYLIFFRYVDGTVEILGIIEGHRDASRWSRKFSGATAKPAAPEKE